MKKSFTLLTLAAFFVVAANVTFLRVVNAATGSIYISPSSTTVTHAANITVSLRINPGTNVDGVQATVNFNPAALQYVGYSTANSAFPIKLAESVTANSVHIERGDLGGGVASDSLIATITFKAVPYSGSSPVSLSGANATSGGSYTNPASSGASISFSPGNCPTGQTGTPPNCTVPPPAPSTPKPPTTTTPKPSQPSTTPTTPTAPKPTVPTTNTPAASTPAVADIQAQYSLANLVITTSQPTRVYVKYGTDEQLKQTTGQTGLATTHNVTLDQSVLAPATTYYYQVVSKDAKGKETKSTVASFTTKGLSVKVTVSGKDNKPLAHKKVELHSTPITAETDENGVATFANVAPGTHKLIYAEGGKQYEQAVEVANNIETSAGKQVATVQNFVVAYDVQTVMWWRSPVVLVTVFLLLGAAAFMVVRKRRGSYYPTNTLTTESIVVGAQNPPTKADSETPVLSSNPVPPTTVAPSGKMGTTNLGAAPTEAPGGSEGDSTIIKPDKG